ncbi:MAG: hypothetical protein JWO43_102 [Candidatus Adlerbacteria bacterium]|nr:hypothetical protein [Candidatus Adlerbacteria bacterium]
MRPICDDKLERLTDSHHQLLAQIKKPPLEAVGLAQVINPNLVQATARHHLPLTRQTE